jgi:titin
VIFLLLATLPVIPTRAAPDPHGARVVIASPENTVTVTTTADLEGGDTSSFSALNNQPGPDGAISLREALLAANTTPTTTLELTIAFSIPITDTGYSYDITSDRDIWTIQVGIEDSTGLPPLARGNVRIDGSTQLGSGSAPHIAIDGINDWDIPTNGLTITSPNNVVRGLVIVNFWDNGIAIGGAAAANNQVAGCYIGSDALGLSAIANGNGISLSDGAHDNLIGGSAAADRNLISGNAGDAGVSIAGAATTNNTVAGNWIGVDATGQAALANLGAGIAISGGAHDNLIGGATTTARNVISGNDYGGIVIQDTATMSNTIAGNWIGVDATGQVKLGGERAGIVIDGAQRNLIGGAGQGNVIAGNVAGIDILGGIANTVAGNTIGLAADGTTRLGNRDVGIYVRNAARDNIIGGTTAGARNVIGGDASWPTDYGYGIYIYGVGTTNNTIQGNYIGVTTGGNLRAGHRREGVLISGNADGNTIGGVAANMGNVIADNGLGGITLFSAYNLVASNLIGLGANKITKLGNQSNGIRIWYPHNVIGPNNWIANNWHSGIVFSSTNTTIISNTIDWNQRSGICAAGANAIIKLNTITHNGGIDGDYPICNIQGGIVITSTINMTTNTQVISNTILENIGAGITIRAGAENRILSNSISGNSGGGIVLLDGANDNIAPPTIRYASPLEVSGTSCALCQVQIFTDDGDQGLNFITGTIALSDGSFAVPFAPGALDPPYVTATNTDTHGNTSPFTPPKPVVAGPPPPEFKVFFPIVRMR